MQKEAKKYYTPEEYLALEETEEYKSEYYQGEIFAMAGASVNHNQIAGNVYTTLTATLANSDCRAFISDLRVWVESKELFTYPDILLVCGKISFYKERNDTITNPLIIFEVLSESTKNYDRGDKFEFYRSLPSFEEYVLIDQDKVHVEHFYKSPDGKWILTDYNDLEDVLELQKIDFSMPLREIYRRVAFESA